MILLALNSGSVYQVVIFFISNIIVYLQQGTNRPCGADDCAKILGCNPPPSCYPCKHDNFIGHLQGTLRFLTSQGKRSPLGRGVGSLGYLWMWLQDKGRARPPEREQILIDPDQTLP